MTYRNFICNIFLWFSFQMSSEDALIERYFKTFDKDGDDKIGPSELKNLLKVMYKKKPDDQTVQTFLNKYDEDKSGTIDLNEFKNLYKSLNDRPKGDSLLDMFKKYDTNNDDSLSSSEVRKFLSEICPDSPITDDDVQKLMTEVDVDKDGSVSFKEFCFMFVRCYAEEQ